MNRSTGRILRLSSACGMFWSCGCWLDCRGREASCEFLVCLFVACNFWQFERCEVKRTICLEEPLGMSDYVWRIAVALKACRARMRVMLVRESSLQELRIAFAS